MSEITPGSVLAPIGQRKLQRPKSKGKHSRKRKRGTADVAHHEAAAPEPASAITSHVLIGFDSVNNRLEKLSAIAGNRLRLSTASTLPIGDVPPLPAAVFLLRPIDAILFAHLPTLCYTASLAHPDRPPTRLVLMDPGVEKRIIEAVGTARVSVLAITEPDDIKGVPGVEALLAYVREHVGEPDAGWLKQAVEGRWLGTKMDLQ